MPQLHTYVSENVAEKLRRRAEALGLSTSKYLAELARREVGSGWPEGYFERVAGKWQGDLQRPPQLPAEERESL